MTQEKQTSIRILQSKPTKKTLGKTSVFLLGLLVGMISTAILMLTFFHSNITTETDLITTESTSEKDAESTARSSAEAMHTTHDDDGSNAYKQHLNEKDLNNLFKHPNKTQEVKNVNKSPFEQIGTPENKKTVIATSVKTIPPLAKPMTKETIPKVGVKPNEDVQPKTEVKVKEETKPVIKEILKKKEQVKEASPEASVKVTIDRRAAEIKP